MMTITTTTSGTAPSLWHAFRRATLRPHAGGYPGASRDKSSRRVIDTRDGSQRDARGEEGAADAASQLAGDGELLSGRRLHDESDRHRVGSERLDAPDLRRIEQALPP